MVPDSFVIGTRFCRQGRRRLSCLIDLTDTAPRTGPHRPPVLRRVVQDVTALAQRREVARRVVLRVVVEVARRQEHARPPHGQDGAVLRSQALVPQPSHRPLARRNRIEADTSRQSIGQNQRWAKMDTGGARAWSTPEAVRTVWRLSPASAPKVDRAFPHTSACRDRRPAPTRSARRT